MSKYLILVQDNNNYFFPYVQDENIDICTAYKKGFIYRIIKKIPFLSRIAYTDWTNKIDKYSKVIVFDSIFNLPLAYYLKRSKIDTYIYSWNSAISSSQKRLLKKAKKYFPTYSFDKKDCKAYSLKYAPMVYSKDAVVRGKDKEIYDVVFVGKDKGRVDLLFEIYSRFTSIGLRCKFLVLGDEQEKYVGAGFEFIDKYLSYSENSSLIRKSKAVLDIQQRGQEGLTLRVVETMFFNKKIITNKQDIDSYDFFDNNNVLILKEDTSAGEILDFINSDYSSIPSHIIDKYDISNWIDYFA